MLVLSLDTTQRTGSCALAQDGLVVCVHSGDPSRTQGEQLPGMLATLLDRESLTLRDVDGYGVAIGPGSFTGLRVGIATMQGLAVATNKPLVGVSGLDGLALLASPRTPADACIVTWIDAWRGDVFAAEYVDGRASEGPVVTHPEALLRHLQERTTLFIGDGAARNADLIRAVCGKNASFADPIAPPLAGAVATLASKALRAGERPLAHAIRPLYVHRAGAGLAPAGSTR
ncbi:MAG: tRNA (adenosine(37)-N6)-threonylcarbamoyltransferase complex dimerization subunit type 1 TsaB [Acidobacteria bacterium]|nr:tRNA (adenosine(37)-N6)-threonylcarbamoyltransferase complex dimerization subunit type 1 TsaB [Acidobacteriota bacterium]